MYYVSPNMTKWFKDLGIDSEPTDMSLSVSLDDGKKVEWASHGLSGLFANKAQIFKPSFYSFISDMQRFNNEAAKLVSLPTDDPRRQVTLGQYLRNEGYSEAFAANYLLPMTAALWSSSIDDVLSYPADQLISFMCNHRMLSVFDRPQVCKKNNCQIFVYLKSKQNCFVSLLMFTVYLILHNAYNIISTTLLQVDLGNILRKWLPYWENMHMYLVLLNLFKRKM